MKFMVLFLTTSIIYCQNLKVTGKISVEDTINVKNARITFIDEYSQEFTTLSDSLGNYEIDIITDIEETSSPIPNNFELYQNYPNPFAQITTIQYKQNNPSEVSIKIYDILGREVKDYKIGLNSPGLHKVIWDGTNKFGEKVTAGIYFYKLATNTETVVKKMIFLNVSELTFYNTIKSQFVLHTKNLSSFLFRQTAKFRVEIINGPYTKPFIKRKEFLNVEVKNNDIIEFEVEKDTVDNHLIYLSNKGERQQYLKIFDVEKRKFIDSIGGFLEQISDIEVFDKGNRLFVCTRKGLINSTGYLYSVNVLTKEKEIILSKSAEIFYEKNAIPLVIASNPYDTLREIGILDTVTSNIIWIDTLDIYDPVFSDQSLSFGPNNSIFYFLSNNYTLMRYNYATCTIDTVSAINFYPFDSFKVDLISNYIYFAGGPSYDISNDSVVGSFHYTSYSHLGHVVLASNGAFLCNSDPGEPLSIEQRPSGKLGIFYNLSEGLFSENYFLVDIISATPFGHSFATDIIILNTREDKLYASNGDYLLFIIDLNKRSVIDRIEFDFRTKIHQLKTK
ncbi:MAG: T9SS type A sorting domain-containing protein [Ignavibacteriae bacterium]|nr:T9SS type A sorting domain-containing protein [Ignavibacteriota bacterium]